MRFLAFLSHFALSLAVQIAQFDSIWWLVWCGWGFVVGLASKNTTSWRATALWCHVAALFQLQRFQVCSQQIHLDRCIRRAVHVTILHQTWNMLHMYAAHMNSTQPSYDLSPASGQESRRQHSVRKCLKPQHLILCMQAHTVVNWEPSILFLTTLANEILWNTAAIKELVSADESRQSDTGTPEQAPLRSWAVSGRTCCDMLWLTLHLITLNVMI